MNSLGLEIRDQQEEGLNMRHRRQLIIGLIMLIGGLVVVAVGAIHPSADPLVAIVYLQGIPALVASCGTVFVFVSLRKAPATQSASVYRIARLAAVAGLGFALAYGAASGLSQVPDWLAGLNARFIPSSTSALEELALGGIGLLTGPLIGAVAARVWWAFRGRHLPPRSAESQ
ncbi:MAG TPA: hypothetical protein VHX87_05085 [Galbitalea sp.]|nr:hypothetical protein [Galbitalea sp.]